MIVQLPTASQPEVRSCTIASEHLPAISIHRFLHKWQMNLHEQFDPRALHTTKEKVYKPIVLQSLLGEQAAPRWQTLSSWNLLGSTTAYRQTKFTLKRRLHERSRLEKNSYLQKSWISLTWYPATLICCHDFDLFVRSHWSYFKHCTLVD